MNNRTITLITVSLTTLLLLPVACVDKSDKKLLDKQHFSAVAGTNYCGCSEEQAPAVDVGDTADYGELCDELACGDQDSDNGTVSCGDCSGHEYGCIGQDENGHNGHCAIPYLTVDTDGLHSSDGSPTCGGPAQAACITSPEPTDPDQTPIFFCRGINLYLYDTDSLSAHCEYLQPPIASGQAGCTYNSDCAGNGVCYGGVCQ